MKYIDEADAYALFDEGLDEYGPVQVAGYTFDPSRVLKELDPIAYHQGFLDWLDMDDLTTDEDEADYDDTEES